MKINGIPLEKIPVDITPDEKLVHYSLKITQSEKDRMQALVKMGFSQNKLIKNSNDIHEYAIMAAKKEVTSGSKKKEFRSLMSKVK